MTAEHPYAHLLRAIADGKTMQYQSSNGTWTEVTIKEALEVLTEARHSPHRMRVKPDTIRIGAQEIAAPMRQAPCLQTSYFVPALSSYGPSFTGRWDGVDIDIDRLRKGLCFASEADANAVTEAVLTLLAPAGAQA